MIRHNQKDVDFQVSEQNYRIRAGDKIMIYPAAIHKDPEIFEKPEVRSDLFLYIDLLVFFIRNLG